MITITQWAADWGIAVPDIALLDLQRRMGTQPDPDAPTPDSSEAAVQAQAQLIARQAHDCWLWRNNSGAYDANRPPSPGTRWGLGNVSAQWNKQFKSPDLVGLKRHVVTPADVGHTLGLFVGVEVKKGDWRPGKDRAREEAQQRFGEVIVANGGKWFFYSGGAMPL